LEKKSITAKKFLWIRRFFTEKVKNAVLRSAPNPRGTVAGLLIGGIDPQRPLVGFRGGDRVIRGLPDLPKTVPPERRTGIEAQGGGVGNISMEIPMLLLDGGYQKARAGIRRRDEFFAGMRIFFNRYVFETWEDFIGFVGQDDEPDG
jgi:hypothetical protein